MKEVFEVGNNTEKNKEKNKMSITQGCLTEENPLRRHFKSAMIIYRMTADYHLCQVVLLECKLNYLDKNSCK